MKFYLTKWYIQILIVMLICAICRLTLGIPYSTSFYISMGLPAMAVIASGIIGVVRLFKGQTIQGLLQIIISAGIGFAGLLFLSFHVMFYPYDNFAEGLTIPDNIELNIPKDTISEKPLATTGFEIYNGMQPGIYTYTATVTNLKKGMLYLKAYEVTQNTPLSAERVKHRSIIEIEDTGAPALYSLPEYFTIYEGDWGQYYAARFELWYLPAHGGKERKLVEKIYRTEGWMR
ncbi:hypothetical protein AM493_02085 [Flavobacterium akiainvivens]|uniref:Uncharacterized protein n=1 Tax=Flavobacterium akiainvivens TaxID=1202724 RepID=A0A0M8MF52_9FLAO|nr:hypothetical protein [Flavobacterium akiainvivens]KOS04961.1 hypothetical protein AM493_02085 [Flavobacterium akiainvivens]SFQ41435.1 hypothetical protein SAMN05444144_104103 [Flavobacterium akiainvivens]